MEPKNPSERRAGFWIRAGAFSIDSIALAFAQISVQFSLIMLSAPQALIGLSGLALSLAYFTLLTGATGGRTLGKLAAGIAIVREDGEPVSYGLACGRYLAYYVSLIPVGLGFVAAGFTKESRALHDYLAGTRVVYVAEVPAWRKALVISATALPALAGIALAIIMTAYGLSEP